MATIGSCSDARMRRDEFVDSSNYDHFLSFHEVSVTVEVKFGALSRLALPHNI